MAVSELQRRLGVTSAVMITVGSVIGSGIFLKPLDIAKSLPNAAWSYGCWIVLGVVCLFGALAYAELGSMFPEAGGMYAFLREGWGRFPAFLYGWCLFLVIASGSMAALAVAFSNSLSSVISMPPWLQVSLSVGMILLLAAINHFGVQWGSLLQNLSTFAKLGALGGIVLAGFLVGRNTDSSRFALATFAAPERDLMGGLIVGCMAIFWAYEGWYQLPFNAAELKHPERDLPRGLIYGMVILILTYVAVNAVYFYLVPVEEMRGFARDVEVPKAAIERAFGVAGGNWLAILICLSVFGAANPSLLSSPRAFYAMARDGLMFQSLMRVHPIYRTPTTAIWIQAFWAALLVVVLKTFRDITEYVVFASLIFYGLTVGAVYLLRRRAPNHPRPFRCPGYPWTPAIFIAVVLFVDVCTLADPTMRINALIGLTILTAGIPVYLYLKHCS